MFLLPLMGNFIDAHFPRWLLDGLGVNFYFGGTSLLIVEGVAMDTHFGWAKLSCAASSARK